MRNKNIDVLKGILIFLVVLGHSIQVIDKNFDTNFLFKIIYSFHMPFFFLISGYLAINSMERVNCEFRNCIVNKMIYLVIPFLSWYMIFYIFNTGYKLSIEEHLSKLVYNVDNGLWYLWVLFMMYMVLWISNLISKKWYYFGIFISIILIPNIDFLGLKYLKWYLIFFSMGFLIKRFSDFFLKVSYFIENMIFYFLSCFFLVVVYLFWFRNFNENLIFSNIYIFQLFKFFVACCGIFLVYQLVKKLNIVKYDFIQEIGKNSLGIYILNFPVVVILNNYICITNIFMIFVISIITLFVSYFISYYLSKLKYLSILFGVK